MTNRTIYAVVKIELIVNEEEFEDVYAKSFDAAYAAGWPLKSVLADFANDVDLEGDVSVDGVTMKASLLGHLTATPGAVDLVKFYNE